MAIDSTVAGENANSFVSLAEANAYFAGHYSGASATAWAALTDPQKESALKRACSIINSLNFLDDHDASGNSLTDALMREYVGYNGLTRYDSDQRLQFPRNIDEDSAGAPFIHQDVKDAQCEQSVYLLSFDATAVTTRMTGVTYERVKAGNVEVEQSFGSGSADQSVHVAPMAIELLSQFFRKGYRVQRG